MAALTAARLTARKGEIKQIVSYKLAAVKCYAGGIAMLDSAGYLTPAAASATNAGCPGVFEKTVDNSGGSAGDLSVNVLTGRFKFAGTSVAQTSVGLLCYAEDDQTVDETQGTNEPKAGRIAGIDGSNVWVDMGPEFIS